MKFNLLTISAADYYADCFPVYMFTQKNATDTSSFDVSKHGLSTSDEVTPLISSL